MCVENCYDECPGFEITDPDLGICQPPQNPSYMSEGVPMDLALSHNLPGVTENTEYARLANEEDLFTMSLNLQNLINPDTFNGDTTALCDVIPDAECELLNGACVCEYDEDVDCLALFGQEARVVPVMAAWHDDPVTGRLLLRREDLHFESAEQCATSSHLRRRNLCCAAFKQ